MTRRDQELLDKQLWGVSSRSPQNGMTILMIVAAKTSVEATESRVRTAGALRRHWPAGRNVRPGKWRNRRWTSREGSQSHSRRTRKKGVARAGIESFAARAGLEKAAKGARLLELPVSKLASDSRGESRAFACSLSLIESPAPSFGARIFDVAPRRWRHEASERVRRSPLELRGSM
jgi:hypothetical protein